MMKLKLLIQERQRQGEPAEIGTYETAIIPPVGTRLKFRLKRPYRSHLKGAFLDANVREHGEFELAEDFTRQSILVDDIRA